MTYDRDYFDEVYAEADGDPWGYWESEYEREKARRTVATLAEHRPPGDVDRILDLGCGNGAKTAPLVERYPDAEVVGVDLSAAALAVARERVDATFERADLLEFVGEIDAAFDAVVAVESLFYPVTDHGAGRLLPFADDLRDALADDGVLVATHLVMPRDVGPVHQQARTTAVLRTVLESAFDTVGRARYDARKRTALGPDEPEEQPYEVWTMRPRSLADA